MMFKDLTTSTEVRDIHVTMEQQQDVVPLSHRQVIIQAETI